MMTMSQQEVVSVYETMVGITERMLDAASANEWDRLAELEQECALYARRLKAKAKYYEEARKLARLASQVPSSNSNCTACLSRV